MKFFIDTANLDEIKEAHSLGLLAGVTTNPSLVAKENITFEDRLREITEFVEGSVSAEVIALDAEGMIREGKRACCDCAEYHNQGTDDSRWLKSSKRIY